MEGQGYQGMTSHSSRKPLIASLMLILSLAIACSSIGWAGVLSQGASPAPRGGKVTVGFHFFSKETLDPSQDQTQGLPYHGPMYDWLIGVTPDGKSLSTEYGVLKSYTSNTDTSEWTFTLRPGIKWHDGVEMTAEDIKFTFEYYASPTASCSVCPLAKTAVKRVEVVNKYSATVLLKDSDVGFADAMASQERDMLILPKHYITKVGPKEFALKPIGSGPWKFASRKLGEYVEYVANSQYWDTRRIPRFESLRIVLAPEAFTRVAMLKRGEVDLISLEPQDVVPLQKENFKILGPKIVGYAGIFFYASYDAKFLTSDIRFRKALASALDYKAIVDTFYGGGTGQLYTGGAMIFSPVTLGYDPSLGVYKYDPEGAKRLLKEIGYKGQDIVFWNFYFATNPEQPRVNEAIASYWRKVGLNVRLETVDFAAFSPRYTRSPQTWEPAGAHVAALMPWARPSLINNIRPFMLSQKDGGAHQAYWDLDKIRKLYREVSSIVDPKRRDARLREINRELYEENWAIPIAIRNLPFAAGPRVAGWRPTDGTPTDLKYETLEPSR